MSKQTTGLIPGMQKHAPLKHPVCVPSLFHRLSQTPHVLRRVMFVVTLIRFMDARVANGHATQIVGVSCVLWSRVVNASAAIS